MFLPGSLSTVNVQSSTSASCTKMPSLSTETLKLLESLSKEYRIHFLAGQAQDRWPVFHQDSVKAVTELGQVRFDDYAANAAAVEDQQPWKTRAKELAKLLVEKAERCTERNESTWRFACEPLVFSRMSGEVAW